MSTSQTMSAFRRGCEEDFNHSNLAIVDEMTQGNNYAAHWTMHGTHNGPFLGAPATGKRVNIQGLIYARSIHG